MATQVTKWGNSLAVRLPKAVAEQAHIQEGDALEFKVAAPGKIELRARKRRRPLSALVRAITSRNRHDAIDWGAPVGKEIW